MSAFLQDLKLAFRGLRARPGFTLVAVLTLALGIGPNTTIFTLVSAVFFHPLPVKEIDRLVNLYTIDEANVVGGVRYLSVSYPNFQDLREQGRVFEQMAASTGASLAYEDASGAQFLNAQMVTANYFDTLGVAAAHGRTFRAGEDQPGGGHPVAVLSHALFLRLFGGDPAAVGKTLRLSGQSYTVVGVTPPGFRGAFSLASPEQVWITTSMHEQALTGLARQIFNLRRGIMFNVVARLAPGVERSQADAAMKTVAANLAAAYPRDNGGRSVALVPLHESALGINQRDQLARAGTLLMAVVSLVLLIACVNLANLLLARAASREKELSIRAALGASRGQLLRQMLAESLAIALLGSAAGLLLAQWGGGLLWSFRPPFLNADAIDVALDRRVLAFTLGLSLLTALLFGLLPALRAARPDLNEVLKLGGRQAQGHAATRVRGLLVVGEMALALVAVAGAGLFVKSLRNAQRVDPGFEPQRLLTLGLSPGSQRYDQARALRYYEDAVERAKALPGVAEASVSAAPPLGGGQVRSVFPEGKHLLPDEKGVFVTTLSVSHAYFDTLRIPVLQGRGLLESDREGQTPVAVVNEAFAARFWPGDDAVGKRFRFFNTEAMWSIVGIAKNSTIQQIGEEPRPTAYFAMRQNPTPFATLHVRTGGAPAPLLEPVRREVRALDPSLVLGAPATIEDTLTRGLYGPRMGASLLSLFGGLALALAAVGLYGVVAYTVTLRTPEIGLRMALGAQAPDVVRMILGQGLRLAAAGGALGIGASLLLERPVRGLLYGIAGPDAGTLLAAAALLLAVAALAALLPVRRAVRIDPLSTLRGD